jgi:hypothetical protein
MADDSGTRARAYDHDIVWRLEQLSPDSRFWKGAVFVVHGMGAHRRGETAVTLRYGFEDAAEALRSRPEDPVNIPATYILEGYWGDFPNLEETMPAEWKTFSEGEKSFFSSLWKARSRSTFRTARWFAWQALNLPYEVLQNLDVKVGWLYRLFRAAVYVVVAALAWLTLILFFLTKAGRDVLSNVLGDVYLYLNPQGEIEQAIVQRIDRQVGEHFLQLLGLNWDFAKLPASGPAKNSQLRVGGTPHVFDHVTWVAHSLGTIVSYNVISDLIARCKKFHEKADREKDDDLKERVKRVRDGLHRFVTIGCPLQKIASLFPGSLRKWPDDSLTPFVKAKPDNWWVNFYDVLDPVSGILRSSDYFSRARNHHTPSRWPFPGFAHTHYWHTDFIGEYILTQTHFEEEKVSLEQCPRGFFSMLWRHLYMLVVLSLALFSEIYLLVTLANRLCDLLKWVTGGAFTRCVKEIWGILSKSSRHVWGWMLSARHWAGSLCGR